MAKYFYPLFVLFAISISLFGQEIDDNILENKYYKKRMDLFIKHPIKRGNIVFFGNSITEAGKWSSYFPGCSISNRGISGDNTDGMIARIHEVIAAQPSKIFIMAGINDMSLQRDNTMIIRQMKLLLRQIKAGSPDTEIYVQSILPLNDEKLKYARLVDKATQIVEYNERLEVLCEEMGIPYIDIYTFLSDGEGQLKAEYTTDGLHINAAAYEVWSEVIKESVEEIDDVVD